MSKHVSIRHFRYPGSAECEGCDNLHPDSTREGCRAHVQQTGHTVHFAIEDSTTYEPVPSAPSGAGKE